MWSEVFRLADEIAKAYIAVKDREGTDAAAECDQIGAFAEVVMPLTPVGPYRVFHIKGTEGSVVELYIREQEGLTIALTRSAFLLALQSWRVKLDVRRVEDNSPLLLRRTKYES